MMKRIFITVITGAFLFAGAFPVMAQEDPAPRQARDSYDPLVPQLFAVDNKNNVFAGINGVDNTVDLMRVEGKELTRYSFFQVDVVKKRHDTHHIYRPKSVAIYEGYVVFLASHRDSCYLAVLDFSGQLVKKIVFAGAANAFSYSPEARELYISGDNPSGYDVAALDASRGIQHVDLNDAAALHYRRPKMAEKIAVADPLGIGMAAIAMSVVFLGLLLLYLVFKNVGKALVARQRRRDTKKGKPGHAPGTSLAGDDTLAHVAIAAAIHLYNEELHDEENTVLTINRVSRAYSPWSSKIHGLNTYFNKIIIKSKHEKI
ncbi:MAG: OadG family protein [Odoribacteraceae bacterium]|jgi:Na+-transporting methylmalonyl-CoA/oxaloacetate decarboxylase gamma subunit|nr:OadG family protein [Odoribacteraceae bacterium]